MDEELQQIWQASEKEFLQLRLRAQLSESPQSSQSSQSKLYKLRCALPNFQDEVRGLGVSENGVIATASLDKLVMTWTVEIGERKFKLGKTFIGHDNSVFTVAWIPSSKPLPAGRLVSGGEDTRVLVWDLESASIAKDLKGHGERINNITIDLNGNILSASNDRTVLRWCDGKFLFWRREAVEVLKGHDGPVQAVLSLPDGRIVTGSSDSTIRIWQGSTCIHTIRGHRDAVCALALMSNVGILSASKDMSVKLWDFDGNALTEFVGHTATVNSVASHSSSGDIASGSEDCLAKIWRDGACVQSIEHPGCVRAVTFLPDGDLVTACSDRVVRVWTREKKFYAPAEEMTLFGSLLSSRYIAAKTVCGSKVKDLPGVEALKKGGTKDGETLIVRKGTQVFTFSWDLCRDKWKMSGMVENGRLLLVEGNPDDSLDDTLDDTLDDSLDDSLDDVTLLQETGDSVATTGLSDNVDPYTGANAYVPGQQAGQPQSSRTAVPPPFTSASSSPVYKHIPAKEMKYIETTKFDDITKKLHEFSAKLAEAEEHKEWALSQADKLLIQTMIAILKEPRRYHESTFGDDEFKLLKKMVLQWPSENIFPVLDLISMMILLPRCADYFASQADSENDVILKALLRIKEGVSGEPALDRNFRASVKVAVNAFRNYSLRTWAGKNRTVILGLFSDCYASKNKAFVTLLLNYTKLFVESKDEGGQKEVLFAVSKQCESRRVDDVEEYREVRFLGLVAFGTLIHGGSVTVKELAELLEAKSLAASACESSMVKVAEVGEEIDNLLKV